MGKELINALGIEDMEKSFDDSLDALKALLNAPLEKGKKEGKEEKEEDISAALEGEGGEEEEEEDEEEDDKEEGKKPKPAMKSLEDTMIEDLEAEAAMDIEPFLRQLVKGIGDLFSGMEKKIRGMEKSMADVEAINKAQLQYTVAAGEMQKAMREVVEKIGETPIPRQGILRKSGERFSEAEKGEDLSLSKSEVMDRVLKLSQAGKLNMLEVTNIEGRMNKGIALDQRHAALIKSVQ